MDDPLVGIQKFFRKIFFVLGVGGKKTPSPLFFYGGIEGILGGGHWEVQKILGILDSKPWPPTRHEYREGWE